MGVLTTILAYKIGRRRGRRKAQQMFMDTYDGGADEPRPTDTCTNYDSFCKNYGSCLDLSCD